MGFQIIYFAEIQRRLPNDFSINKPSASFDKKKKF